MPARVLVFCTQPVPRTTAAELEAALHGADLLTLAECHDLPEGEYAAVDELWRHFRIDTPDASDVLAADIAWHAEQRPVQLSIGPPIPGELQETLDEWLTHAETPAVKRVRDHVSRTVTIVSFEMGIPGSNHLAATITEVLAFHFAERADGLVWFYHRDFVSPDDRGATLLTTGR